MKKLKMKALLALAGIMSLSNANATLSLTTTGPDDAPIDNPYFISHGDSSNPNAAYVSTVLGISLTPEVFKMDRGGAGTYSGILAASYLVTYTPANGEGTATITHVIGQPSVDSTGIIWLLAKDGNAGHFAFNLTGIWNGTETIEIADLWGTGRGSFSHISIGNAPGTDEITPVPEPATMIAGALLLLPFAASTLRILRKNRAA